MASETADYYLMDARTCVGNCALWWGPDGAGYLCDLDKAGLYSYEEAHAHRDTDLPIPQDVAEGLAVRHVRVEGLQRYVRTKERG